MQCTTWSAPSVLVPTCMWGDCDSTTNTCLCHAGFKHDFVLGRYSNCGLPVWAPIVFFSIAIALNSIVILYGAFVLTYHAQRGSMLWRACAAAVFASLLFIFGLICLYASEFEMPWYGALFTVLGSVTSAHVAGSVLIGVLSPVAASERLGSIRKYEVFFLYVIPGFMLIGMLFSLSFGFAYDEIALGMAFVFLCVAVCASLAAPFLYRFPTKLISALSVSLSGKLVMNSQSRVMRILRKVKAFRISAVLCSFVAATFCYIASIIHFTTGTLPMSWCFYFGFVTALAVFHLQVAHFAKPSEEPTSSSRRSGVDGESPNLLNRISVLVSSASPRMRGPSLTEFSIGGGRPSISEIGPARASISEHPALQLTSSDNPAFRRGSTPTGNFRKSLLTATKEEEDGH